MKKLLIVFLLTGFAVNANAQTAVESVQAVINNLFTAMKMNNTSLLKSVFADSAILQTIETNTGKVVIKTDAVADFVTSISKLPAGAADEQISFGSIKIDADLASVWTPYKFYFNGKFSHCGANSFQLVRINGEWKIQYLIDTRHRANCD